MKSKITDLLFKKEVNTKFGLMYQFQIKFENGDGGSVLMKNNPPAKKVGEEAEYSIEEKDGFKNIKFVQAQGAGNFTQNPARLELDKKIAALNNAVAMVCAGKASEESLRKVYEKFLTEYL